jgi:hypothetical protein
LALSRWPGPLIPGIFVWSRRVTAPQNRSVGFDGITVELIRLCASFFCTPARLCTLQRKALKIGSAGVFHAHRALGRRELPVGVDLLLQRVEKSIAPGSGSGGSVIGVSPRLIGCDL